MVPRICIPPLAGGVFFKTYKWHLRAKPGAAHRLFHAIQKCNVFIAPTQPPPFHYCCGAHILRLFASRQTEGTHERWVHPLLVIWPLRALSEGPMTPTNKSPLPHLELCAIGVNSSQCTPLCDNVRRKKSMWNARRRNTHHVDFGLP